MQVLRVTRALDVDGSTSISPRFDGLRYLVKDELLSVTVVDSSLNDKISSTDNFNDSVHWQLRDNVEWSVDEEAVVTAQSLDWLAFDFVKIQNLPSLVNSIMSIPHVHSLTFSIFVSGHIKNLLVVNIGEEAVMVSEELPPSRIGAVHLNM